MIWTIAKKEFLENVLSRKFLLAFILATVIMGTGVYCMSSAYKEKKAWYDTQLAELEENATGYQAIAQAGLFRVLQKPEPLTTLISGQKTVELGLGQVGTMLRGAVTETGSYTSPLLERFGMLDLTFVVGFLMSLMAIIFSYNSISGEKESGTLKLTLTNSVPRDHVLLGKYIGGVASVLLPFLLSMLLAFGLIALVAGLPFSSSDYLAIGILVLIGCATISAFYLIGMLVSCFTKRSAVSLLTCLFIWIFLVQGIGNIVSLTATVTAGGMTYEEYRDKYMSIQQEVIREYGWENMQQVMGVVRQRQEALTAEFRRQQEAQLNTALKMAIISPAESYRNIAQALAGLSWTEGESIQEQCSDYLAALSKEYSEWRSTQQIENRQRPGGGYGYQFPIPTSENFSPKSRLEEYYQPWGISERVGVVTSDLVSILLINILLFVGAYVAFLRYDVR
jgi:ABC-type transport system involved in multi-copper enzyme maturation permease subunit